MQYDLIITGDRFLENDIWLIEEDIKMLFVENVETEKFGEKLWKLRMHTKLNLNPKEITVKEYYELIAVINKESNGKN